MENTNVAPKVPVEGKPPVAEAFEFAPENHEYIISNVLPPLGFSGVINEQLKQSMMTAAKLGLTEIKEGISDPTNKMKYLLQFNRNEGRNYFFLNKIKAIREIPGQNQDQKASISHTFTLFKQKGYNARQMKNLLRGGSILREYYSTKAEQVVRKWTRLDLNKKNADGNFVEKAPYFENKTTFDFAKELSKLPISGMNATEKEELMKSLAEGEIVRVNMLIGRDRQSIFLEATPHLGDKLACYNQNMDKVYLNANGLQATNELTADTIQMEASKDHVLQEDSSGMSQNASSPEHTPSAHGGEDPTIRLPISDPAGSPSAPETTPTRNEHTDNVQLNGGSQENSSPESEDVKTKVTKENLGEDSTKKRISDTTKKLLDGPKKSSGPKNQIK